MERVPELLRRYGLLNLNKDQRFLTSSRILHAIVDAAELRPSEVVLEIGAGVGNLTRLLCERARKVYAIEKDGQLMSVLESELGDIDNLELMCADALEAELPACDVVVSNIPYSIATPLTFRLLEHEFDRAILTYQLELAKRLTAKPSTKGYGRLSVMVQHHCDVRMVARVPRGAFYPPPKVESATVRLIRRPPPYTVEDEPMFFELVRAGFEHRRKKLRNALAISASFPLGIEHLRTLSAPELEMRAEELTGTQLAMLANIVHKKLAQENDKKKQVGI